MFFICEPILVKRVFTKDGKLRRDLLHAFTSVSVLLSHSTSMFNVIAEIHNRRDISVLHYACHMDCNGGLEVSGMSSRLLRSIS